MPERAPAAKGAERPPARVVVNVIVAGLGGQGAIKASDILADVAFRAGRDVKKAEVHGMSQRGGSVTSDVRFGDHQSPHDTRHHGRSITSARSICSSG